LIPIQIKNKNASAVAELINDFVAATALSSPAKTGTTNSDMFPKGESILFKKEIDKAPHCLAYSIYLHKSLL